MGHLIRVTGTRTAPRVEFLAVGARRVQLCECDLTPVAKPAAAGDRSAIGHAIDHWQDPSNTPRVRGERAGPGPADIAASRRLAEIGLLALPQRLLASLAHADG